MKNGIGFTRWHLKEFLAEVFEICQCISYEINSQLLGGCVNSLAGDKAERSLKKGVKATLKTGASAMESIRAYWAPLYRAPRAFSAYHIC